MCWCPFCQAVEFAFDLGSPQLGGNQTPKKCAGRLSSAARRACPNRSRNLRIPDPQTLVFNEGALGAGQSRLATCTNYRKPTLANPSEPADGGFSLSHATVKRLWTLLRGAFAERFTLTGRPAGYLLHWGKAPPHRAGTTFAKLLFLLGESGEPCRIRTCDPLIKSQLLYQLS